MPSPRPMYLTGIWNWSLIPITTPPLAVPSNLVIASDVTWVALVNGFACSNVALGVGSFSMQCVEEEGILKPFTRDTFSSCIKATYCEIAGTPYPIFKNPKDGGFKKSQKGCCVVYEDLSFKDGFTWEEACANAENQLLPVFKDGKLLVEQNLQQVRAKLHDGKF